VVKDCIDLLNMRENYQEDILINLPILSFDELTELWFFCYSLHLYASLVSEPINMFDTTLTLNSHASLSRCHLGLAREIFISSLYRLDHSQGTGTWPECMKPPEHSRGLTHGRSAQSSWLGRAWSPYQRYIWGHMSLSFAMVLPNNREPFVHLIRLDG